MQRHFTFEELQWLSSLCQWGLVAAVWYVDYHRASVHTDTALCSGSSPQVAGLWPLPPGFVVYTVTSRPHLARDRFLYILANVLTNVRANTVNTGKGVQYKIIKAHVKLMTTTETFGRETSSTFITWYILCQVLF